MFPSPSATGHPRTVEGATNLLRSLGPEAKVMAGGQSLLPLMELRLARPSHIVDLGTVPELRTLNTAPDRSLKVGAMVTETVIEKSAVVRAHLPVIAEASAMIADPRSATCPPSEGRSPTRIRPTTIRRWYACWGATWS